MQKDGTWYTYGLNLTKNVCEVFGQHGYIRTNYLYTPYGEVSITGDVDQPFQWSSEYFDRETSLIYYNYRYYNAKHGRWLQFDPVEFSEFYKVNSNNPIQITDYLGLWAKDPKNENIRIARKGDTLMELARSISGNISDLACLWPIEDTADHGYPNRIKACDRYDVSNLTETEGKQVEYYLERGRNGRPSLNAYSEIFPNSTFMEASKVPQKIKEISNEGGTPIGHFVSAGHGGVSGSPNPDKKEKRQSYSVTQILNLAVKRQTFEYAKKRKGPIRCWFTRSAKVRFSGCSSSATAREFAKKVLRKGATALGTNQKIANFYKDGTAWIRIKGISNEKKQWVSGVDLPYFSNAASRVIWETHNGEL
ncbi:MAG: RHS repeat-associated core domain-containing protein [Akkermansiaceae bacterium]|nr:RHS repeat-associated core domain-containing protein [Akkermansiaceae bacterium]